MIKDKNIDSDALITSTKVSLASGKVMVGNSSGKAASVTLSGDVTVDNAGVTAIGASKVTNAMLAGSITQANLTANALDGTVVKNTAAANVIGGIPVVHIFEIADAATADYDIVLTHKTRVLDALVVKTAANAAAANTVQIKSTASAITNAIDANINDTIIARAGSIDDANSTIAAAGTLRVSVTKAGGNAACQVYVFGVRSA